MYEPVVGIGCLTLLIIVPLRCIGWWLRRSFRVHLSTLVVLSLAAGGLMWLNLRPVRIDQRIGWPMSIDPDDDPWLDDAENDRYERYFGWPIITIKPSYWQMFQDSPDGGFPTGGFPFIPAILIDGICAFFALTVLAEIAEWQIARNNTTLQIMPQ